MFRKLMTSAGMVLLASSFAFAGQTPAAGPKTTKPRVTASKSRTASNKATKGKRHRKHRKATGKQTPKTPSATPQQ